MNNNFISTNNKNQLKTKPKYYSENKDNENNSNLINVGDNKKYYENLYRYLTSLRKLNTLQKKEKLKFTGIYWNIRKIYSIRILSKKLKIKKKYNNRLKAHNYILENNILYFTGYGGKNNCKLRVPLYKEKNNIIITAHTSNGHIGINRTTLKIKEEGYFWETLIDDVKEYIEKCPKCILSKKGKKIYTKLKIIITNGPLDRVIVDGWELDSDLKTITGFGWVIDIIDHFSKF